MNIQDYLDQQEEIYNSIFQFLDDEDEPNQTNLEQITQIFKNKQLYENRENFYDILQIITKISENHYRHQNFIKKVETILNELKGKIKQKFSNLEIYELFKKNIRILYFLVKNDILTFDQSFTDYLINHNESDNLIMQFLIYMYPKTKNFFNEERIEIIENHLIESIGSSSFDKIEKCQQDGQNSFYICQLIRDDSVDEFISYITQNTLSLSIQIENSIYESNIFLSNNDVSLIEYAAFFGSIQIFKYLLMNNVELTPSLWIFAIYGKNAEIINILKENHVELPQKSYEKCLKASVKCHHNDIANYFLINFCNSEIDSNFLIKNFFKNILGYSFHYHNIAFLVQYFDNQMSFCYSCQYNYLNLLKLLLKKKEIKLNFEIISIIHIYINPIKLKVLMKFI